MAGSRKNQASVMMMQIKKDRLRQHIDNVEKLINEWIRQLSAPDPFQYSRGTWGWQQVYQPQVEEDPDKNHMIRMHLRSRTLWSHHARWVGQLNKVFTMCESIIPVQKPPVSRSGIEYTADYVRTALWQAFLMASGLEKVLIEYGLADDGHGVKFGAYLIVKTSTAPHYDRICREHGELISRLKETRQMKALLKEWAENVKIQESMQSIAREMFKTSGFLSPCRFCRKLWY